MPHGTRARRIARLEQALSVDDRIPVYVEDEQHLAARIDALVAAGVLAESDRPRCVFWLDFRSYAQWQRDDDATRRLQAQAAVAVYATSGRGSGR
jgi:hypothetical protein